MRFLLRPVSKNERLSRARNLPPGRPYHTGMMSKLLALRTKLLAVAEKLRPLAPTLARFTIGWVFIASGWKELHDMASVIDYFKDLGIPFPEIQAPFSSGTQLVAGVAIMLGLLTRLAAVPLTIVMTVAITVAKKNEIVNGLSSVFAFPEYLYIVILIFLILEGPGPLSLDRLLEKKVATSA